MPFFMMYWQMWAQVGQTWIQMVTTPFCFMAKAGPAHGEIEGSLSDDLWAIRRIDCVWPDDITGGRK